MAIKIHTTPETKITLPRHEHAARRARAKILALPATPAHHHKPAAPTHHNPAPKDK